MASQEALVIAGVILVFLGMILIFFGVLAGALSGIKEGKVSGKTEAGGVILIGPIPIIFGTSWRMAIIASILAIALIVLALILLRRVAPAP